jgi:hypothetical protein
MQTETRRNKGTQSEMVKYMDTADIGMILIAFGCITKIAIDILHLARMI